MKCKDCTYFREHGVCSLKHIRVKKTTESCAEFNQPTAEIDTQTCATCKHHYFPDKTYKNYSCYINCKGEFFLCKCRLYYFAKFLHEKCSNYEKQTSRNSE